MKKKFDLSLYLVLDPIQCGGIDGLLQTTRLAVENGVTIVQLRADEFKKGEWYAAAKALKELLTATGVPLIINNEVDVALSVDADWVHIGQKDLPVCVARDLLGPDKILGLSTSNEAEVVASYAENVDYIGIGPVFPTTSKKNAPPDVGVNGLQHLAQIRQKPAVAIGGINLGNMEGVLACGVEGIAVVSAICGQPDIALASRNLAQGVLRYRRV